MRPEEQQMGVPPHWNAYVTVANVDEAAKKAESLGAKVLAPPFDVMDYGRMAVLQDPTGAVFQVWQAKTHIGAQILNEPGALCWTELSTRDTKAAEAFYTKLFGWTREALRAGRGDGVHRVQRRRAAGHRHDADARAGAGAACRPTGCPTSGGQRRRQRREGEGARRIDHRAADRHPRRWGASRSSTDPQGAMFAVFKRRSRR